MRPWRPRGVLDAAAFDPKSGLRGQLSYIVVEELAESVASLVVSPWPNVDERGRLRFGDEDDQMRVVASRDELSGALSEYRIPIAGSQVSEPVTRDLRERPLTVGDVFGARLLSMPAEEGAAVEDPYTWLSHPVLDVTADARDAAKAQTSAAVAAVLTEADVEQFAAEFREEDEPPQPQGPTDPAGGGAPGGGAPAGGREGQALPFDEEDAPCQQLRTWRPQGLEHLSPETFPPAGWDALWYLVVDEIQENVAVLVVSAWPGLDDRGRLRFGGEERQVRVAVTVDSLRELLSEQRVPLVPVTVSREAERVLRERPLAVGDVFAANLAFVPDEDGADLGDPRGWLVGPVLDISSEAREAAKAQANAAVAGVLMEDDVELMAAESREEDESPPEPSGGGSPEGGGGGGGGSPLTPAGPAGGAPDVIETEEEPQVQTATQRLVEA